MIQGIDAYHENNIDWPNVSQNIRFAYLKATQGATYTDPMFNQRWQHLKTTDIARGAYMFWNCQATAQQHWDNISSLGIDFTQAGVLPLTLDIEEQKTTANPGADKWVLNNHKQCVDSLNELVELIKTHTGRYPVIYSDPSYFRDYLGGASWPQCPLWIAGIQDHPPHLPNGWSNWTFWQNSWSGKIDGSLSGGNLDMNVFNGTQEQLNDLANITSA